MGEELFRKSALDKLASPERLDVLMEVTPGRGRIAIITIGSMLGGLVLWAIFGTIPERIDGQGMLIRGGGQRQLFAGSDGALTDLRIQINDLVKEGQVVGHISQIGTSEEIKTAKQNLDRAERDYQMSKGEDEATIVGVRETIKGLEDNKRRTQGLLQQAVRDVARLEQSLKDGLVTRPTVDQAIRDRASFEATLVGLDGQIRNQEAQIRSVQQRIRAKEDDVSAARRELARLTSVSSSLAEVRSTVAGHVVELQRRVGDFVRTGEIVAIIEPPSSDIQPVVYISSTSGKRIKPGMEAQVSPTTVRREEYGFMKGEIQLVGEYPVSQESVVAVTGNAQVAKEFLESGTKIQVNVALLPNAATPSGYSWSSSSGPPFKIEGGTKVGVSVVAARTSPFNYYVTPYLRGIVGG